MLQVTDSECIKHLNFNDSNDAYTIVFYPGWHLKESVIHVGSTESDLNDPKAAKHIIEFVMAISYQRRALMMSLHADKLKTMVNYPVVELHLDTDSLSDEKQGWLIKKFRQAITAEDTVLIHMQVIPVVILWRTNIGKNDYPYLHSKGTLLKEPEKYPQLTVSYFGPGGKRKHVVFD